MKTKRGTYYYIQVGPSFYAGTRPVMVEVKRTSVDAERLKEKRKNLPKYQLNKVGSGYGRFVMRGDGSRRVKSSKAVHTSVPMKDEYIEVPSNQFVNDWTSDATKAKKFRIHSKALAKADELANSLGLDKVKPKVILFEGDRT